MFHKKNYYIKSGSRIDILLGTHREILIIINNLDLKTLSLEALNSIFWGHVHRTNEYLEKIIGQDEEKLTER